MRDTGPPGGSHFHRQAGPAPGPLLRPGRVCEYCSKGPPPVRGPTPSLPASQFKTAFQIYVSNTASKPPAVSIFSSSIAFSPFLSFVSVCVCVCERARARACVRAL